MLSKGVRMKTKLYCKRFRLRDFFLFPSISVYSWSQNRIILRRATLVWGWCGIEFWRVSVS